MPLSLALLPDHSALIPYLDIISSNPATAALASGMLKLCFDLSKYDFTVRTVKFCADLPFYVALGYQRQQMITGSQAKQYKYWFFPKVVARIKAKNSVEEEELVNLNLNMN